MSKRILVVEDDFANQRVASLFIAKLGFEADIAENGSVAVEKASESQYDLILMDCQMPIMDGFEACRQIRAENGPNQNIPIVALTANVIAGIDEECQEAGMNDVLNKPVQLDNMQAMLEKWLNRPVAE
ncbi:response regulator [Aliikangiella marina]|uniref:Response regulator n=1 Tax=Aliikangiella marina TaxID=1712262 RepID=A0A545T9D8_9GAMM|nr:response regulator [Aliikangiella marina]TQV73819.1 response regulator [Aliikangiella marina]